MVGVKSFPGEKNASMCGLTTVLNLTGKKNP